MLTVIPGPLRTKIHSNSVMYFRYQWLLLTLLLLWCVPSHVSGDTPASVFAKHRAEILAREHCIAEGYAFAMARVQGHRPDGASKERAIQKGRLIAKGRLIQESIRIQNWPADVNPQLRDAICDVYASLTGEEAFIRGVQSVYTRCGSDACTVVVAAPKHSVTQRTLSWDKIRDRIDQAYHSRNLRYGLILYLEICPRGSMREVIADVAQSWGRRYPIVTTIPKCLSVITSRRFNVRSSAPPNFSSCASCASERQVKPISSFSAFPAVTASK